MNAHAPSHTGTNARFPASPAPTASRLASFEVLVAVASILVAGGIAWGNLTNQVRSLEDTVRSDIQPKLQELSKNVTALDTRLATLETKVDKLDARFDQLDSRLIHFENRFTQLETLIKSR
jgi:peptidoglycan hydrolase CwlO-like protein